jgi:hypothetical protein
MMRQPKLGLLPCPFCGKPPKAMPTYPKEDGDDWTAVACVNKSCAAMPRVENYGRGHKRAAVRRWNRRHTV